MTIRLLIAEDRAEFVRVHEVSRAAFSRYMPLPPEGKTAEQLFDDRIRNAIAGVENDSEYRLVGLHDDGRIVGFFNLFQVARLSFQNAIAGWSVSSEFVGNGYATEGVGALLDFAFAPQPVGLGLHRVQANIIPTNPASLRVAEKNGFRKEGLALRYLCIAGQWQDHDMCGKTAEEHTPTWLR